MVMVKNLFVTLSILIITIVLFLTNIKTGYALSTTGVVGDAAVDVLFWQFKVTALASFCLMFPCIFLFDVFLKKKP